MVIRVFGIGHDRNGRIAGIEAVFGRFGIGLDERPVTAALSFADKLDIVDLHCAGRVKRVKAKLL